LSTHKIQIIGIGDDGLEGLTSAARKILEQAEVILGPRKTLSLLRNISAQQEEISHDLAALVQQVSQIGNKRVVILAVGDPLFYGTARYLFEKLGKERFEVLPHVSTMQLAFARVKENWDGAMQTDLATQPLEVVVEQLRSREIAGLFTTESISPAVVAKALLDRQIDYFTVYVCENLGSPNERVTQSELADVASLDYSPLNVMILVRKPNVPDRPAALVGQRLFGNPDSAFLQSKPKRGLLTPAEVRSMALAELDLGPRSIVWDVGAGSGSVSVEAAQIAANGHVYAIEMDAEDYQLVVQNAARFSVKNVTAVLGKAPEAWQKLPAADAIFIGGSGRDVSILAEQAFAALKQGGRLVVSVGSIENLGALREMLHRVAGNEQVWMINLARGYEQMERMRFESLSPVFLLKATKGLL
jgi:precorrin-6B C5,15-methyltransferase / cobalt-precorrin-6B C5,C15-methyltransferase